MNFLFEDDFSSHIENLTFCKESKNKWLSQRIGRKHKNRHRNFDCSFLKKEMKSELKRLNHKRRRMERNAIDNYLSFNNNYNNNNNNNASISFQFRIVKRIKTKYYKDIETDIAILKNDKKTDLKWEMENNKKRKLSGQSRLKKNKNKNENNSKNNKCKPKKRSKFNDNNNNNNNMVKIGRARLTSSSSHNYNITVTSNASNNNRSNFNSYNGNNSNNYINCSNFVICNSNDFANKIYDFSWSFRVSNADDAQSSKLTIMERDNATNENVRLTFGELTEKGVTKALINLGLSFGLWTEKNNNVYNSNNGGKNKIFYDLGTASGKVPIQVFLQFNNEINKCIGIEYSKTRYLLAVKNIKNLVKFGYNGRKFQIIDSSNDNNFEKSIKIKEIIECDSNNNNNSLYNERTCEIWHGNLFDYPNGIMDANIVSIAVAFPSILNEKLLNLMSKTQIGCKFLTYHNISTYSCFNNNILKGLLKDYYDVSWTQCGFPFYTWQRIGVPNENVIKYNKQLELMAKQKMLKIEKEMKLKQLLNNVIDPKKLEYLSPLPIIPLTKTKSLVTVDDFKELELLPLVAAKSA